MKKRGISPLISWVLLIGFVVGLSIMVTTWVKEQAESSSEKLVKDVESDIKCNDLAFNANLDCTILTQPVLTITNRGKFAINKLRLRQPGSTYDIPLQLSVTKSIKIKPEDLKSILSKKQYGKICNKT